MSTWAEIQAELVAAGAALRDSERRRKQAGVAMDAARKEVEEARLAYSDASARLSRWVAAADAKARGGGE